MKNSLVRAIRTHENGPILLSIHPYVLYIYSVTILLVYNHVWLGPDNNSYTQALQGVSDHLLRTRLLILSLAIFRDFSGSFGTLRDFEIFGNLEIFGISRLWGFLNPLEFLRLVRNSAIFSNNSAHWAGYHWMVRSFVGNRRIRGKHQPRRLLFWQRLPILGGLRSGLNYDDS